MGNRDSTVGGSAFGGPPKRGLCLEPTNENGGDLGDGMDILSAYRIVWGNGGSHPSPLLPVLQETPSLIVMAHLFAHPERRFSMGRATLILANLPRA